MHRRTALTTALAGAALIAGLATGPARASGIPVSEQEHGAAAASVTCGYYTGSTAVLKQGSVGNPVKELQCLLERCGYYTGGAISGYFDSALKQAVLHYQRDHDLGVDGIVGPRMWALLRAGVC
ncbi:peptidoglycan-binding protein [Streptomyces melanogenes]|uniref:peptidoglycan-binding protein n=1 Tax=Streptomyces melanogenes TaxID=67326 RepID=UPI0037B6B272